MARSVRQVDDDLKVEAVIWRREQRAGEHCSDADAAMRRIDALLEERLALTGPAKPSP